MALRAGEGATAEPTEMERSNVFDAWQYAGLEGVKFMAKSRKKCMSICLYALGHVIEEREEPRDEAIEHPQRVNGKR